MRMLEMTAFESLTRFGLVAYTGLLQAWGPKASFPTSTGLPSEASVTNNEIFRWAILLIENINGTTFKTWYRGNAAGRPTCAIWFPAIVSSLPLSGSTVGCASSAVFLQSPQLLTSCKPPPFRSTITSNTPILQTVFQYVHFQKRTCGIHRFFHRHSTQMNAICKNYGLQCLR